MTDKERPSIIYGIYNKEVYYSINSSSKIVLGIPCGLKGVRYIIILFIGILITFFSSLYSSLYKYMIHNDNTLVLNLLTKSKELYIFI